MKLQDLLLLPYLTLEQAAQLAQLNPEVLRRKLRAGDARIGVKVGGEWRISRERLDRWLSGDPLEPAAPAPQPAPRAQQPATAPHSPVARPTAPPKDQPRPARYSRAYDGVPEGMKRCTKCNEIKPASPEHFAARPDLSDGLASWCKGCVNAHSRAKAAARRDARQP